MRDVHIPIFGCMKRPLKDRDINWLYFNERVLLEAGNKSTPLLERLKFLAIFSSNLDEYFKVRISRLRQLGKVEKELRKKLVLKPNKKLKFILKTIDEQQKQFGLIIQQTLGELREHGIFIRKPEELINSQQLEINKKFDEEIYQYCELIDISNPLTLKDGGLYLLTAPKNGSFKVINIPTEHCGRFITLNGEGHNYLFLDDVLKMNIEKLFPNQEILNTYTIKLSRDAELYLEDDLTDLALVDKIYQSLGKRASGQPTRLLFDEAMPKKLQDELKGIMGLGEADMIPGGKYHNLSDFFGFPKPLNTDQLQYEKKTPLAHPKLSSTDNIFKTILEKDQLVHFPYQEFDMVEDFIRSAAESREVKRIKMSLYRIAKTSVLTDSLLKALDNGKEVTIFVEAQARFDEQNNIKWGRIFEEHGATVLYSMPNIKVHSKVALIERQNENGIQKFAFIGTGNFNAKTAKIYCDHGLFTAHEQITEDLDEVFKVLERKTILPKTKKLLVSPFTTRTTFLELIEKEIENSKSGRLGKITIKMNSLEDAKMIGALYKASEAGVEIRLLVRGFCCLQPKDSDGLIPGEKPICITSIIDRYLEHGRIYLFENGGKEIMYIGSADWMTRNLDRRIEVLTPILDKDVFQELKDILDLQLSDTTKARIIDAEDTNQRVSKTGDGPELRSQYAIYDYLKAKLDDNS